MKKVAMLIFVLLFAVPLMVFAGGQKEKPAAKAEPAAAEPEVMAKEAPMLAAKVKSGELPALEDRIPKEPYVYEIAELIGTYQAGPITVAESNADTPFWPASEPWGYVRYKRDYSAIEPYLGKGWEFNDDYTELTVFLREGLKWSDGVEYTSADVEFYYNGIQQHPEGWRSPLGNLINVEVIDKYTFKYMLELPDPTFVERIAVNWGPLRCPRHMLEQYHPDYNTIEGMTRAAQWEKFQEEFNWGNHFDDPTWPVLWPWIPQEIKPGIGTRMERNPYYWWVDKEGKQLPYVDEVFCTVARDSQVLALKILAGEIDEAHRNTNLEMVPTMLDEGPARGVEVKLYPVEHGSPWNATFNYMHKEPAKKQLFRTPDFRKALSLAINRNLINRVGLLGLGKPTQGYLVPSSPWYTPEVDTAYTEYDPDTANEMLDAIGLDEKDDEGFRLDSNGEKLSIVYYTTSRQWLNVPVARYVVDGWQEVGIRTLLRVIPQEQMTNVSRTADFDVIQAGFSNSMYPIELFRRGGGGIIPGGGWGLYEEHLYWQSKGDKGIKPDDFAQALFDMIDEARYGLDEAKRTAAYKSFIKWCVDNIPVIGFAGPNKELLIHKTILLNVPKDVLVGRGRWDRGAPSWFFAE